MFFFVIGSFFKENMSNLFNPKSPNYAQFIPSHICHSDKVCKNHSPGKRTITLLISVDIPLLMRNEEGVLLFCQNFPQVEQLLRLLDVAEGRPVVLTNEGREPIAPLGK